jgi:hypothetical protein
MDEIRPYWPGWDVMPRSVTDTVPVKDLPGSRASIRQCFSGYASGLFDMPDHHVPEGGG